MLAVKDMLGYIKVNDIQYQLN